MANANIDQNDIKTLIGYNETTGDVERVRVDPTTGAILVFVVAASVGALTAIPNAKRDGNDMPTLLGYNETTGLVEALRCGNDGSILITN